MKKPSAKTSKPKPSAKVARAVRGRRTRRKPTGQGGRTITWTVG